MHRNYPYNEVREVVTQLLVERKVVYAPGSTQETVMAELENALVPAQK